MKKKLFRITTVPKSINGLLKGQLKYLNNYYDVVAISSPGREMQEIEARERVRTISIRMERRISIFNDFVSLCRMWLLFRKEKPFIIHTHTDKAGLIAMIAGKLAGVPHRIHTYAGLIFPSKTGLMRQILWATDWITCYCSTIAIPEGLGVKNDLKKARITSKPLNILGNGSLCGIDLDYYKITIELQRESKELQKQFGINDNEIVFSYIGRIVKDKGIEILIKAFINLFERNDSKIHLIIAGDFDDRKDPIAKTVEDYIRNHPKIHWTGFMKDVRPVLIASNVFILPSFREGFPNVVLQACALEVPVIVTDINGSNEIVENMKNGIIVPVNDEKSLSEAMIYMRTNLAQIQSFGKAGKTIVTEKYDQKIIWQELITLYNSLK